MATVTLAQLRTRARQRADMENSGFVSDSELNAYVNASYAELYDLLVSKFGEDYFVASPHSITTTSNTEDYSLPGDFYKLLGVDFKLDSRNWASLKRFEFTERNLFASGVNPYINIFRYRILGNSLRLTPMPEANETLRVWYVPLPTTLSSDSDSFSGINGFEEYVVIDAAIKMLNKEESDPSALMAEKAAIKLRIEQMAEARDEGQASTVQDTQNMSNNFYFGALVR